MAKTIAENLTSIVNSKEAIRQSIVAKGQACDKTVPFSQYAGKIAAIIAGTEIVVQSNADFYQCVFSADGLWSGYKAVLENGRYHFETTITEGLKYTSVKPEVGKIYTVDALAQIAYLYDITGTAGQCPNLADCVTITCKSCNEKYCQTHDVHDCNNNNPSEKCPNLPECDVISCLVCGEKYCQTHKKHECEQDPDSPDNPDNPDSPDNPTVPDNCPYSDSCTTTTCINCGNSLFCTAHRKKCICGYGQECPDTKWCIISTCDCGTRRCIIHTDHPANVCCKINVNCDYITCDKCGEEYCNIHHPEHPNACEPSAPATCYVEGCTNELVGKCEKCQNDYCKDHYYTCDKECEKDYCEYCIDNHDCGNTVVTCYVEGCTNEGHLSCAKCGEPICNIHHENCATCALVFCPTCFAKHTHLVKCDICGKMVESAPECEACHENLVCPDCKCSCQTTNTICRYCNNDAIGHCETCGSAICSAHTIGDLGYVYCTSCYHP